MIRNNDFAVPVGGHTMHSESKTSVSTSRKSADNVHHRSRSTYELRRFNLLRLLRLILILLTSCACSSFAQDINENTVFPGGKESVSAKLEPVGKSAGIIDPLYAERINREYVCPGNELVGLALFFSIPCKTKAECSFLGTDQECCKQRCRKGLPAPPKEPKHRAILGVNRMCSKEPVHEVLPVKRCENDGACEDEGRICCPDRDLNLYCRTAAPVWSQLPFPGAHPALMSLIEYMQCQPAPPPFLNLFPKPCNRTIDCLPNLCCQEGSRKFCRPAKKSVLSLVAQATQRFTRG